MRATPRLAAACFAITALATAAPALADGAVPSATTRPWAPMYRAEDDETTDTKTPSVVPPLLELGVAPALETGRSVMVASVVSPTLTIRTWERWRLGGSLTPMIGHPLQSFEGCTPVRFCLSSSWRAAARAEYQVNDSGAARPWAAIELGLESWRGMNMVEGPRPESGLTPIFVAQGGIDTVTRGSKATGGLGVFGGVVLGHQGFGLQAGVRVAFAVF